MLRQIFLKHIIFSILLSMLCTNTAVASDKVFRCKSKHGYISDGTSDYGYFKIKSSAFSGDKLFYRRHGHWKKYCKIGNNCQTCFEEVYEDSFICRFGGGEDKDDLSHIVIDMIAMSNNWFRHDGNGRVYLDASMKCEFVR